MSSVSWGVETVHIFSCGCIIYVVQFYKKVDVGDYKMINEHIVQSMTERIANAFSPEKIIVFGSWARNEATKDSDIDFLVITHYKGSKRDIQVAIRRELKGFGIPKDVIVASKEDIEQKKDLPGYIYGTALREGKVVYERTDQ